MNALQAMKMQLNVARTENGDLAYRSTGSACLDFFSLCGGMRRNLEDFNRGDVVVTSGENGNYLKDIPIGRIASIEVLDYDTALDIELEPIIDFLRLDTVIVVDRTQNNDKKPFSLEAK